MILRLRFLTCLLCLGVSSAAEPVIPALAVKDLGADIKGQILTANEASEALPEGAIVRDGDRHLAFLAGKERENGQEEWRFTPIEVFPGATQDNWIAVSFARPLPDSAQFALNNAYYLIAELRKGEAEHSH